MLLRVVRVQPQVLVYNPVKQVGGVGHASFRIWRASLQLKALPPRWGPLPGRHSAARQGTNPGEPRCGLHGYPRVAVAAWVMRAATAAG